MKQISLQNIFFLLEGKKILSDINFDINNNDIITIVGPNGGGKTSLINLICRIVQPSKGKVIYHKKNLRVVYIPQNILSFNMIPITVKEFINLGKQGLDKNKIKQSKSIVEEFLTNLHLDKHYYCKIGDLSPGLQKKVTIVYAMQAQPDIIIFDEPTSSMDIQGREKFLSLLLQIKNHTNSIVVISHDANILLKNSNKLLCLDNRICMYKDGNITEKDIKQFSYYYKHSHTEQLDCEHHKK